MGKIVEDSRETTDLSATIQQAHRRIYSLRVKRLAANPLVDKLFR